MQVVGAEGISYSRRVEADEVHENTWYVGHSAKQVEPGAQAFTVGMMLEGMRLPAHFHEVNQYQLFFEGGGLLGNDPIGPMTVFYTDAYASYGPIIAGADGLMFYTLRYQHDPGLHPLPEERGLIKPSIGRRVVAQFDPTDEHNQADLTMPGLLRRDIARRDDDGMQVEFVVAGPGTSLAPVFDEMAAKAYVVVLDGEVVADGVTLTRRGMLFNDGVAERSEVATTDRGVALAVMTFPTVERSPRQRRSLAPAAS